MYGRLILTLSAVILFAAGVSALFAADELMHLLGPAVPRGSSVAIQLAGSGLLGFAAVNWMSRGNRIGGIYARPIGIGNLLLFTTAAMAILKAAWAGLLPTAITVAGFVFAVLAAGFVWLVFAHDPLVEGSSR